MVSIPRGIHSHETLRNRWIATVLILGGIGACVGYFVASSFMTASLLFLLAQVIALADYVRLRKATDVWIEEMLSDLHIDIDDLEQQVTPALVLEQWKSHIKKERSNPLMTRGADERGFTSGKIESELDAARDYKQAEHREEYEGIEGELTIAQQVKFEADRRYAEHAQQRWEQAERNDPDLIEAGVDRLGDLVATDFFKKNHDPDAVSKLLKNQSSSDDS